MQHFDITTAKTHGHAEREKDVLFQAPEFKLRVVDLAAGESITQCGMPSYVVFVGIEGQAEITVAGEQVPISQGQVLVTEPATLSMSTDTGVRLLGIQSTRGGKE
jgi:quercetin dioxygenase-like cupin family protein